MNRSELTEAITDVCEEHGVKTKSFVKDLVAHLESEFGIIDDHEDEEDEEM